MKKLLFVFITLCLFSIGKLNAQTVYITKNGKKYHAKNCDVAKTGKKGIDLAEAKKQGYEACKVCKPDAVKPKEQPKSKPKKMK